MKTRRPFHIVYLVTIAIALLAVCLVAIKTSADSRNKQTAGIKNQLSPVTEPKALVATEPIAEADDDQKGFWLTVRARGFETKEMTISAGDYFVIVQNASGLDRFGLRLERETGERIHEVRLPRLKKHWRQMIRFTPGHYIVSEIDHPDWTCRITVTPPQ